MLSYQPQLSCLCIWSSSCLHSIEAFLSLPRFVFFCVTVFSPPNSCCSQSELACKTSPSGLDLDITMQHAKHYGSFGCARLSWKMENAFGLSLALCFSGCKLLCYNTDTWYGFIELSLDSCCSLLAEEMHHLSDPDEGVGLGHLLSLQQSFSACTQDLCQAGCP